MAEAFSVHSGLGQILPQLQVENTLAVTADLLHTDVVSPLSYMCSILARTLSRINCARPWAFFCRLHCDPDGPLPGPTGLLRSLIS